MAGWTDSSAAASGTGGGGWRFTSHSTSGSGGGGGGGGGGGNNRWRERGRGRPPPQAHYRYRPANSNSNSNVRPSSPTPPHHHSGPAMGHRGQGASSTSTRRSQPPRLPFTDKSPIPAASAIMPPADATQPDDKANSNAANFECNVCFDMAADPVVTKCGHLFCWECLYQWLHVHSHHRECPVCKGQVGDDAIIPIYGRGGSAASVHTAPPRPTGARVESHRQQQAAEPDLPMAMDDDEDDPFDLQEIRLGFGVGSLRDAMPMMTLMPGHEVDLEQHYYHGYTNAYDYDDDFGDLLGFPVFASAGAGSSQGHGVGDDLMEALFNSDIDTHHPPALRTNHQNRGRHGRRQRARAGAGAGAEAADHSSTDGMVMGGGGAFYRNTGAFPNVTRGGSSRLYGGWTERGGRSNRNSRDAAVPRIASRRQRTNYD